MKRKIFATFLIAVLWIGCSTLPVSASNNTIYERQATVFGGDVVFALKSNDSLWAWGCNAQGEAGNGKGFEDYYDFNRSVWVRAYIDTPYLVLDNVKYYEGGTWAIKKDNSLWVWGETAVALDLTTDALSSVPQKYMDDVSHFSYGASPDNEYSDWYDGVKPEYDYNFYAVKTDGTLIGWGKNAYGELGDGTTQERPSPIRIMDDVKSVKYVEGNGSAAIAPVPGYGHIFVVKKDGSLWSWGADAVRMYDKNCGNSSKTPKKDLDDVKSLCSTKDSVAALTNDGRLYLWGRIPAQIDGASSYMNHFYVNQFTPVANQIREAHIETDRIAYITNNNVAYIWGDNRDGYYASPTQIMNDIETMAMSSEAAFLCKTNGELWKYEGEIYDRESGTFMENSPKKMLDHVVGVYYDGNFYAVKTDGTLWGQGHDNRHALMGKAGEAYSEDFIKLMDGVKISEKIQQGTQQGAEIIGTFTDVVSNAWYAEPIRWAIDHGVTAGTSDTTFSPAQTCTNAQILTFIWRAAGSPEPTIESPYELTGSEYYAKAVTWAYEQGIVGTATFDASMRCTRAMTVEYLWKQAGSPVATPYEKFIDVNSGADYAQAVAWAVENGVTAGTTDTTFSPQTTCSRAEIVTFLYRAAAVR